MSSKTNKDKADSKEQQAPSLEAGDYFFQFMGWLERNLKAVCTGAGVIALAGFMMYVSKQAAMAKTIEANGALIGVTQKFDAEGQPIPPGVDDLKQVASQYPESSAGERASYLVGHTLFQKNEYDAAKSAFESFITSYPNSVFVAGAHLGVAACQDSLGMTDAAIEGYKKVVSGYGTTHEALEAKLKLATLLQQGGDFKQAHSYLKELSAEQGSMLSFYAMQKQSKLEEDHPELVPAPAVPEATSTNALPQIPLTLPELNGN